MEIKLDKLNLADKEELCKLYLLSQGYQIDNKYWYPIVGTCSSGKFAAYIIEQWRSTYEKGIPNSFNLDEYAKLIFFFDELPPTSFINWKETLPQSNTNIDIVNYNLSQLISDINQDDVLRQQINRTIWRRKIKAFLRPLGGIILLFLIVYLLSLFKYNKTDTLFIKNKITHVETAIDNIKSIEKDLELIEQNLNQQLAQAINIEREYDQVKLLKELTEEEIRAFRIANEMDNESTNWTELFVSFILGILASILGYYVIELIKYWKR